MPSPCRKCGATKTEPTRHGITYHVLRALGYRLRKCSRCRRTRALPRSAFRFSGKPDYANAANREASRERGKAAQAEVPWHDPDGFDGCPRCGKMEYERVSRNWLERGMGWAPMARCLACRKRFPYPQM